MDSKLDIYSSSINTSENTTDNATDRSGFFDISWFTSNDTNDPFMDVGQLWKGMQLFSDLTSDVTKGTEPFMVTVLGDRQRYGTFLEVYTVAMPIIFTLIVIVGLIGKTLLEL